MLFIEPAFAYARQLTNTRSRLSPLDKAVQTLKKRLENGYEPEWANCCFERVVGKRSELGTVEILSDFLCSGNNVSGIGVLGSMTASSMKYLMLRGLN